MITGAKERSIVGMTFTERTAIRERPGGLPSAPDAVSVVFCDIPEGMTIAEYRRSRPQSPRRRGFLRRRA
jgi:hypothetical protein